MADPTDVPVTDEKDCLDCKTAVLEVLLSLSQHRLTEAKQHLEQLLAKIRGKGA